MSKNNLKDQPLLKPLKTKSLDFKNKIVFAALTRMRTKTGIPNDLHVKYYTKRAESCGFILTECTGISDMTHAFPGQANLYNEEHAKGWKKVVDSVHSVGGKIVLQIWHGGRATGKSNLPEGKLPLSSYDEAIRDLGEDFIKPKKMDRKDMDEVKQQFITSAKLAKKLGFDGLQLHGANGYLIDQFLRDGVNKRTDGYGGSIENRCKYPLEIMDALIGVFGADRVGIKISPVGRFNDMFDSTPEKTYTYFLKELNKRKVLFIEVMGSTPLAPPGTKLRYIMGSEQIKNVFTTFKKVFTGLLIANNGITVESGNKILKDGEADMISYGKLILANPDFLERVENGWEMNTNYDYKSFFGGDAKGYIDYPFYKDQKKEEEKKTS